MASTLASASGTPSFWHPMKATSMTTTKTLFAAAFALAASIPAVGHAADILVLTENFDDISALAGWTRTNNSLPPGQAWFQGNPGIFAAQSGPDDSYIATNFLSANNGIGTVDNWLITPELTLAGASTLSFYTRTDLTPGLNDTLEVRFSAGSGTATSGFTTLLATVGDSAPYPGSWQQLLAGLTLNGSGRFAFRYTGDAELSNFIGIDTVSITTPVPEPSAYLMFGLGLAALALLRRQSAN
jgi:hypothetical protein